MQIRLRAAAAPSEAPSLHACSPPHRRPGQAVSPSVGGQSEQRVRGTIAGGHACMHGAALSHWLCRVADRDCHALVLIPQRTSGQGVRRNPALAAAAEEEEEPAPHPVVSQPVAGPGDRHLHQQQQHTRPAVRPSGRPPPLGSAPCGDRQLWREGWSPLSPPRHPGLERRGRR